MIPLFCAGETRRSDAPAMNVVSRAEADIPDDPTCCCTSGSDQGLKTTQNVAAGVAGIFIPVLWFGMDFQGTADKETQALQARQQYLASLAAQRRAANRTSLHR